MRRLSRLLLAAVTALGLLGFGLAGPAFASTGTQVADCTFATLQADLQAGGDYYYAAGQCPNPIIFTGTIELTGAAAALTAQGDDVTLDGGNDPATGAAGVQLFSLNDVASLDLTGLRLSNGSAAVSGGGAIDNDGTVSVSDSTFSNNVDGYQPNYGGGAILNGGGASLTITGSTFTQNGDDSVAGLGGGALYNFAGTVNITNSTFVNNGSDGPGSAIYTQGAGSVTLANSTVWKNTSTGLPALAGDSASPYLISGTIVADNGSYNGDNYIGSNCSASVIDKGYNLEDHSSGSCGFSAANHDIVGQDPQLDPNGLQDHGGPTQTVAEQATSPAIDAIPTTSGLCPASDQRGMPRPDNGEASCDIGAYEYQDPATVPTTTALTSSANPSVVGQQVTYTATVAPAPDGGTVSFQDGGSPIGGCGSQPLDSSGRATCQVSYPSTGTHTISAVYSGDPGYVGSSSATVTQTVTKVSSTALASSANPAIAVRQVIYTATISPAPDGGTVAFTDSGNTISGCGAAAITTSGTASCSVSYPTAGTHTVTAAYSGDNRYAASTSTSLTQTITSDLSTTLTVSPNPVARGGTLAIAYSAKNAGAASQQVALSYTLTDPHGTATTSSLGTVTIKAGSTVTKNLTHKVPRTAATGTWTVIVTASDATGSSISTARVTVR